MSDGPEIKSIPEVGMFRQAMAQEGIVTAADVVPDGRLHRFYVEGDKPGRKNGWYVLSASPGRLGRSARGTATAPIDGNCLLVNCRG